MGGGLSPPYSPICVVGKLEKKKNKARGTVGLFPLPIVPSALSIFSIRAIFTGIPSGSLCGGESVFFICFKSLLKINIFFTREILTSSRLA